MGYSWRPREILRSCISWRWKGPGGGRAGGLLAANALCLGPGPPLTRRPDPTGRVFEPVEGSPGSSSLGPAHPGHSSPGRTEAWGAFSARRCSPRFPVCTVPLGQGRRGTLEAVRRNWTFIRIPSPRLCTLPLPSPRKGFGGPTAALPMGQPGPGLVYEVLPWTAPGHTWAAARPHM